MFCPNLTGDPPEGAFRWCDKAISRGVFPAILHSGLTIVFIRSTEQVSDSAINRGGLT
jgi:hypothetical protein